MWKPGAPAPPLAEAAEPEVRAPRSSLSENVKSLRVRRLARPSPPAPPTPHAGVAAVHEARRARKGVGRRGPSAAREGPADAMGCAQGGRRGRGRQRQVRRAGDGGRPTSDSSCAPQAEVHPGRHQRGRVDLNLCTGQALIRQVQPQDRGTRRQLARLVVAADPASRRRRASDAQSVLEEIDAQKEQAAGEAADALDSVGDREMAERLAAFARQGGPPAAKRPRKQKRRPEREEGRRDHT